MHPARGDLERGGAAVTLPEDLVHRVFEDEAAEEVLRDVIYDALVEFNDSVNPFFADWGLPSLLKKVMPIGSGTVIKSIGAIRGEFDKRLEPEMRKFLLVFVRKSKKKIAGLIVSKGSDPKFIALRQSVVDHANTFSPGVTDVTAGDTRGTRVDVSN